MIATRKGLASRWVRWEVGAAWGYDREIVVLLPKQIGVNADILRGDPLTNLQCIEGSSRDWDALLIQTIERHVTRGHDAASHVDGRLKAVRSALEQAGDAEASGDANREFAYCELHQLCRGQDPVCQEGAPQLVLCHTYLNLQVNGHLKATQDAIEAFFKNGNYNVHNAVQWSLFGSMEIAVTFRAPWTRGDQAGNHHRLQVELEQHLTYAFESMKLDPPPDYTHFVFEEEYVRSGGVYVRARRRPEPPAINHRKTYAFIVLDWNLRPERDPNGQGTFDQEAHTRDVQRIHTLLERCLRDGVEVVEQYGISKCKGFLIFEIQLPCGDNESLNRLSGELHPELVRWNKDTFIAYGMMPLRSL